MMLGFKHVVRLSAVVFVASSLAGCRTGGASRGAIAYPEAKRVDVVEDFHGVKVADPYRWLEDSDTPDTRAWIEAQNEITFDYLERIPQREAIKERITKLWNYERFDTPYQRGGRYFMERNDGLQNQDVLYTLDALSAPPRVLIDPNTFSQDGTISLAGAWPSEDGRYMAYGISDGGSDWREFKVRDVVTGRDLDDHLEWIKFSGAAWTHDHQGFFYGRFDEPKDENALTSTVYYKKIYYHRLGSPQAEDQLIHENPDEKEWGFEPEVTEDGRYLIIYASHGTRRLNLIYYRDLTAVAPRTVELITEWEAQFGLIGNDGPVFYFFTDYEAPRARVIAIDTRHPEKENWREIIPEAADTLRGVTLVGDKFICQYLSDAHSKVRVHEMTGRWIRDVELPGLGAAGGFGGQRRDTETFYSYTDFATPATIYRYDMTTGKSAVFKKPDVDFDPADYETKQVFYHSKDGTRVPMFITHKKGIRQNGKNPTYLYGYGGFDIPITPGFSVSNLVWMEMGGVYAVANIRGGGEYGKDWHEAGMKLVKQNVFDDFIAAAEWLIDNDYTRPSKLAIGGGSNGGLLVGACMTQRPELFGACLPAVGVLDMLRFHRFTIGWAWTSDYGCATDPEEFKALYAYSPLHNVKSGTKYPATMITTGDHDDRVVPAHSFKFAAAIQAAQAGPAPTLIRIETRAGHGAGKPTSMRIEEYTDRWAFLVKALDMRAGLSAAKETERPAPAA
jgi:prolyl oligopeptidase